MGQVYAALTAGSSGFLPVEIIPVGCQEVYVDSQKAQIVCDIPPDAARSGPYMARIGIGRDERA